MSATGERWRSSWGLVHDDDVPDLGGTEALHEIVAREEIDASDGEVLLHERVSGGGLRDRPAADDLTGSRNLSAISVPPLLS